MFLLILFDDFFALSWTSVSNKNERYFVTSRNRIFQKIAFPGVSFGRQFTFVMLYVEYLIT